MSIGTILNMSYFGKHWLDMTSNDLNAKKNSVFMKIVSSDLCKYL